MKNVTGVQFTYVRLYDATGAKVAWKRVNEQQHGPTKRKQQYRLVNVQVFHRHGDRTVLGHVRPDLVREGQIWAGLVAPSYMPYNAFVSSMAEYDDSKSDKEYKELGKALFSWSSIASRLRGSYMVNCRSNFTGIYFDTVT